MAEKEFIEREEVLKLLGRNSITKHITFADDVSIYDTIKNLPAADVVKVVRGEWIEEEFESYIPVEVDITGNLVVHKHTIYRCSICGRTEPQKEPYCHCGAKMDK